MQRQRRRSRTATFTVSPPTALDGTPRPRWIPRITTPANELQFDIRETAGPCAATKTQLTRCQVSAVPEKTATHTATLGCGANTDRRILQRLHRSTNRLQPKKFMHWLANLLNSGTQSEEERLFKVQLQWPSCSCAVYTLYLLFVCNNNVQFCKANYCC